MKRKGERNIPDFSRKPKPTSHETPDTKATNVHDRPPQPKPQATSSKSGRRGT
jgi:hypothetical protein